MRDDVAQTNPLAALGCALRCEYLAVSFDWMRLPGRCSECGPAHGALSALGVHSDGEREVLGVWLASETDSLAWRSAYADLEIRGVERLRFAICREAARAANRSSPAPLGAIELPHVERSIATILAQVDPCYRGTITDAFRAVLLAGRGKAVDAAMAAVEAGPLGEGYAPLVLQWRALVSRWAPVFALPVAQRRLVLAVDRLATDSHKGLFRAIARHGPFTDSAAALGFIASALQRAERRLDRKRAACVASVGLRAQRLNMDGRLAIEGG